MENSRFDKLLWTKIDPELWFELVIVDSEPIHLNTAIAQAIWCYTLERLFDEDLFCAFREEFSNWDEGMFDKADIVYWREMKRFLRNWGVYTGYSTGKVGKQLAALTRMDQEPLWDPVDLSRVEFETGSRRRTVKQLQNPLDRTS